MQYLSRLLLVALLFVAPFSMPTDTPARTLIDTEFSPTGSWAPSVGGTATYTLQTGSYTKIGKFVVVACRMTINQIGTGSTNSISGLPFPVVADPLAYGTGAVYVNNLAASVVTVTALIGIGVGNQSVGLYSLTGAGTGMALNNIMGNGSAIYFTGIYLTP